MDAEYAIIGGGVVGLSIAWGLLKRGKTVVVLDGDDGSFRASRGNFGLVWVQSKGLDQPRYAQWCQQSAAAWADFAAELGDAVGRNLGLEQDGGYDFHFSEESLSETVAKYEALKSKLGGNYPFEVLGKNALRKEEPEIGSSVKGAILHHQDGHVNPLRLLQSLAQDVRQLGGKVLTGKIVTDVDKPGSFKLTCRDGTIIESEKIVLSAGLGAAELGPKLGFIAPVSPLRGQNLVTEKLPRFINRPSLIARQVNEGGVQIGVSSEKAGFDDGVTVDTLSSIASNALKVYPCLTNAKIVRTWAALRIMSPDGLPIYQESNEMPGAFLVTCHSGVSLAAAHARFLPDWLEGTEKAPNLEVFRETRFAV
ncbi:NAD(P)/FAD-dependent oxidoreductase [Aliiroseovarius crassostreae]|uniref:NAD(P)/FAD-dependent oxidoreductase n=1 Tax=Aliiroseovarius crassostreae TaxID=154981 RepID=UPI003C7A392D